MKRAVPPIRMANLTMTTSGLVTITLFAILMIWDGYSVYFGGGVQSSVSIFIISWFGFNPVPFYAGTIVGHLVCNMWPDVSRLKAAWNAWNTTPSVAAQTELHAAIDELVNANHGPLRYFMPRKRN